MQIWDSFSRIVLQLLNVSAETLKKSVFFFLNGTSVGHFLKQNNVKTHRCNNCNKDLKSPKGIFVVFVERMDTIRGKKY